MTYDFDRETQILSAGTSRWDTTISSAWSIGDTPNGGYAVASSLRAMAATAPDAATDPLSVTAHFLRPTLGAQPGHIETELVRPGRRASTVTASLHQQGKERIRLLAAYGNLGSQRPAEAMWDEEPELGIDPIDLPEPQDCRDRAQLEQGVDLPILSRLDVRIDPEFAEPGRAGIAESRGWIRFSDGRPVDVLALVLFCDAFPPSLYSLLGRVGWVPTVELTIQIRRRPAPGWIRARFRTTDVHDGSLVEDGELWDSEGNLVARSRQLALLLPPGT